MKGPHTAPRVLLHHNTKLGDNIENVPQNIQWRLAGIDRVDDLRPVEIEHRLGLLIVRLQPLANDVQIRVVEPVLAQCAALQPFHHLRHVRTGKMKDGFDIQGIVQNLRLPGVARDTIQHQHVIVWIENIVDRARFDVPPPQIDCGFIRHQFALAGILDKQFAQRIRNAQIAESVATREVKQTGNGTENFALRALS